MTPVERVARAIYERRVNGLMRREWDSLDERVRGFYVDDARAALAAMREPSEGMMEAADDHKWGKPIEGYAVDVSAIYRAMIDKALEEG